MLCSEYKDYFLRWNNTCNFIAIVPVLLADMELKVV